MIRRINGDPELSEYLAFNGQKISRDGKADSRASPE